MFSCSIILHFRMEFTVTLICEKIYGRPPFLGNLSKQHQHTAGRNRSGQDRIEKEKRITSTISTYGSIIHYRWFQPFHSPSRIPSPKKATAPLASCFIFKNGFKFFNKYPGRR